VLLKNKIFNYIFTCLYSLILSNLTDYNTTN